MRSAFIVLISFVATLSSAADFKGFVATHCLDCHDDATKKGELSMEALEANVNVSNAKQWLKVLEQIERHNMPPTDEDQPTSEERGTAVSELEGRLVAFASQHTERKPTVLRRLNRTEYRNTIGDLLHLHRDSIDPTRDFPDDVRVHGFPSNGEKLVTSSFLMRQYVEAAEQIVERAVHFEPKPETRHWDLRPPFDKTSKFGLAFSERWYYFREIKQPQPYESLLARINGGGNYHPIDDLHEAAPQAGWYRIRILAQAKYRNVDLDPKDPALDLRKQKWQSMWDPREPIRLSLSSATLEGIDPDNKEAIAYADTYYQSGQRELAVWDLPDDKQTWLECRIWLNRGEFPRLSFPNGPTDANYRLNAYFKANKARLLNPEQLAKYEAYIAGGGSDFNAYMFFESARIEVSKIEFEGPLFDAWPPESHQAIFGAAAYKSDAAGDVLLGLASRAWRRPAQAEEVAPMLGLVRDAEKKGATPEVAIQEGLKAVLCSPEFLYREEGKEALSGYEVASRLSYFLWSSMPDESLIKLASGDSIMRPEVLRQQALRMLDDPRSKAFVDEFLNGWLSLKKLGSMAPDVRKFAVYYDDALEPAMRMETRLFFLHALHNNLPVDRFLDSEDSFVNKPLAQLYGIDLASLEKARGQAIEGLTTEDTVPHAGGDAPSLGFVKVKLPDARRGGLLGQASVLTLTANGVDTSPVIRGIWLLENILGAPPAPPPPNVPTIEPDIRGAKTIREQLAKHQESATCRSCHRQIDPPGFALENFDAIGRWRGHYINNSTAVPIDASGQFGVVKFKDVSGFKAALMDRRDQFARCLVEKMLIYALGRDLEITDRPYVRKIVESAAKDGYRLRDLILLCVESEIFRHK